MTKYGRSASSGIVIEEPIAKPILVRSVYLSMKGGATARNRIYLVTGKAR